MSDRKTRIAVLHFSHETVSFLPNETTLDDFIYPGSSAKGEALLRFDPKNCMGGFVQVARDFSEVELVGIESPLWPKTYLDLGANGVGILAEAFVEPSLGKHPAGRCAQHGVTAAIERVEMRAQLRLAGMVIHFLPLLWRTVTRAPSYFAQGYSRMSLARWPVLRAMIIAVTIVARAFCRKPSCSSTDHVSSSRWPPL
ncbi:M81 family metallopeptidase [Bradyrhizobium brasilense]|uniref:M81 family metallopeptidase n=1 Tax=Bradyrhizobium brasilense TaxID=1419277 RepID=UPI001F32F513|nr:M81 family metallopeptidase [Bradyrhizobium brasilense]